jgi:hypothetical protein
MVRERVVVIFAIKNNNSVRWLVGCHFLPFACAIARAVRKISFVSHAHLPPVYRENYLHVRSGFQLLAKPVRLAVADHTESQAVFTSSFSSGSTEDSMALHDGQR